MDQKKVWDAIAEKWVEFRRKPKAGVENFLYGLKGKVLDLGCGSGRNFFKIDGVDFYGVDFSEEMLRFADRVGYVELKKSSADYIPYDNDFFDGGIFIAVLHCIESIKERRKSLEELFRVLKPEACVMITVLSDRHDRVRGRGKEVVIPWTIDDVKYLRYYYIYDMDELRDLLISVGFEIVKIWNWKNKNTHAIVRKTM